MGLIARREDIERLAVAISDDAIICGIRPNADDPERINEQIVEVEFVRADLHRGAVDALAALLDSLKDAPIHPNDGGDAFREAWELVMRHRGGQ